jgi:hypothetical protein
LKEIPKAQTKKLTQTKCFYFSTTLLDFLQIDSPHNLGQKNCLSITEQRVVLQKRKTDLIFLFFFSNPQAKGAQVTNILKKRFHNHNNNQNKLQKTTQN